ncbi:hypothetical protein DICVIV_03215 [Dictyocaulus viviparus]|uniref:PARP catalytic domain-containing protein n=1 Tax=Dictyocaulus viviparus TaxID=29172 RepID=A0A0D8Y180_DICVI|nr:hypothetical protein DICVIV_03215 [Dictyocaulus viviparus]
MSVKIRTNEKPVDEVNRARESLNQLTEVEVATRILTASSYRADVDRIRIRYFELLVKDFKWHKWMLIYIIEALECRFTEMNPDDDMSQKILRYIHVTSDHLWNIKGILTIVSRKATLNFREFCGDENQMCEIFFFTCLHLRNLSVLKSFLESQKGFSTTLLLQHIVTQMKTTNKGVYVADSFAKSSRYCQPSAGGLNYMLLCRVDRNIITGCKSCEPKLSTVLSPYKTFVVQFLLYQNRNSRNTDLIPVQRSGVALGKCYKLNSSSYNNCITEMPPSYDSMHVIGRKYADSTITVNVDQTIDSFVHQITIAIIYTNF